MSYHYPLSDPRAQDVQLSGNKAANLAALQRLGFPIPDGIVVSTQLCRDVMAAHGSDCGSAPRDLKLPRGFEQELNRTLSAYPPQQRFAVRSSSPQEDSAAASYAGQFDTFLNCCGFEEVRDAVVACILSLWSTQVIAYRQFHGIHQIDPIAVFIQEMVDCDAAGVAFSLHPVTGDLDTILINAHAGLGVAVVDGEVAVDEYQLRKDSLALASHQPTDPGSLLLSADDLAQIGAMVLKLEQQRSFPQDIEWGIARDTLFVLQSRPVTVFPPAWSRERSFERFPYAITPMIWEVVEEGFHRSLKFSFELMGLPPLSGRWFSSHNHHVYFNKRAREIYLRRTAVPFRHLQRGTAGIRQMLDELAWLSRPLDHWDKNVDIYLDEVMALTRTPVDGLSLVEIWAQIHGIRDLAYRYFAPNVAISQGHAILMRALGMVVAAMVGRERADMVMADLTLGCKTKTGLFNDELKALADLIAARSSLAAQVKSSNRQQALQAILADPHASAAFERFLSAHYHREVDHFLDPYYPSLGEQPLVLVDNIRIYLEAPNSKATDASRSDRRQRQAMISLLSICPESDRADLLELVELTRTYIGLDDTEHYQTSRLHTPTRRSLRAIGRKLVEAGILEHELDICFSTFAAVDAALVEDSWDDLALIVRTAKASFLEASASPPPWDLDQAVAAPSNTGIFVGIACSGGVVEGQVCIVRTSADFSKLRQGDILIAPATPPAWTALFYNVAAVVTEGGGALSHGAVIAREIGIPAVMGLPGIVTALQDGARVRVDGGRGTVTPL
jgi:rifampicin phosphotransferase